jgi:hypothetical protein
MSEDLMPRPDLADLATRINHEHQQAEQALRSGLEHARAAGVLLLEAKGKVAHGQWLAWLEANVTFTPRAAQGYMRVAREWGRLEAKAKHVSHLTYREALAALAQPSEDDTDDIGDDGDEPDVPGPKRQPVSLSDLPPALAFFREKELLSDEALAELLTLQDDYGPEVVHRFHDLDALTAPLTTEDAWGVFNVMRPLDHPTLWPIEMRPGTERAEAVAEALRRFLADARAHGGTVRQWQETALWWAAQVVLIDRDADVVRHHLGVWRESFRAALGWVVSGGFGPSIEDPEGEDLEEMNWGYRSDLRHAGALGAAEAIRAGHRGFPAVEAACNAGLDVLIDDDRGYPLPSCMQRRVEGLIASVG